MEQKIGNYVWSLWVARMLGLFSGELGILFEHECHFCNLKKKKNVFSKSVNLAESHADIRRIQEPSCTPWSLERHPQQQFVSEFGLAGRLLRCRHDTYDAHRYI